MKILVTGGAGYIGSTVCSALEDAGHFPVVLDSLVTGSPDFVRGRAFYHGDVADRTLLATIVRDHPDLYATLHFAGRVILPESVKLPALYYRENAFKSLTLFETLAELGQRRIVFSSTASLYADTPEFCVSENSLLRPVSPYARSKWMAEQMLEDLCLAAAPGQLRGLALRYFNPIGADPKLRSGPYQAEPSHLLGRLLSAVRNHQPFAVTGTDYPTRDGSGLRDFIHIWDLALAHVAAVERFDEVFDSGLEESAFNVINLGTGTGVTVREFVRAFIQVSAEALQVEEAPRRPGDSTGAYADISRAQELLRWAPRHTTAEGIESALAWTRQMQVTA